MEKKENESGDPIHDLIIIGGGPAGTSAAIYASRGKNDTLVLDKDIGSSAMGGSHVIANYPGFPEPIEAEKLLKRMRQQALSLGAEFVQDKVIFTDLKGEVKVVATPNKQYRARSVIVATGSMGRDRSIKGESGFVGRGVAYCAVCDGPQFENKSVIVVGQPDRVVEEIELISRYASRIYLLPTTGSVPEDIKNELSELPVKFLETYRLDGIGGDSEVEYVTLTGKGGQRTMDIDGVFLYLQGNRPVLDFITDYMERGENGCLVVDTEMRTGISGVFAAGDATCKEVRQISLAVGQGCRSALSADRMLKGKEKLRSQWS